jgi:hypothetical protein
MIYQTSRQFRTMIASADKAFFPKPKINRTISSFDLQGKVFDLTIQADPLDQMAEPPITNDRFVAQNRPAKRDMAASSQLTRFAEMSQYSISNRKEVNKTVI